MIHSQQFWAVILFYGAAQGVFIAGALLLVRRGRRAANRLLAAMVLAATAGVTAWFLVAAGLMKYVPAFGYAPLLLDATLGPLLYFYVRTLLRPDYRPKVWVVAAVILLPATARFLHMYLRGFDPPALAAMYERLRASEYVTLQAAPLLAPALLTAYSLVFMFLAWRNIRRAESMWDDEFSNGGLAHVRWLKVLNACLFAFGVAVVAFLVNLAATLRWYAWLEYAESLVRMLIIQTVAVAVFFLPDAFFRDLGELTARRRRLTIEEDAAAAYLRRLREYMEAAKPYRAEDLRLGDLADRIGVSAHVLSQLINDHLHTNFSDFINRYRVDDTREMLRREENDRYTLVALAREAGFNSKTSFYRAFKKHTGMAPSEFRLLARRAGRAAAE